ncbi:YesL family protein [Alkalihalophilus sp. As8PL]|uniref:YesL family protein n=1 Tax=Alkalihalophilus sp. As8PL TaxID=3237103 RepID=A0AB39BYG8_9BACI
MGRIIFQIAELIYKFIALNVLWLVFFVLGLGIFGFMPATVGLFQVIRDWIKGEKGVPLFSSYLKYFKGEFIRSNLVGAIFLVLFYIIYVNFSFVGFFYYESIQLYIYIVIFSVGAIILMTFLNVFSVMAHFEYKTLHYIKVAAGLVFAHPFISLIQLIWLFAYFLISINYPKIFIGIGISVFAYVLMSINYSLFKKYKAV